MLVNLGANLAPDTLDPCFVYTLATGEVVTQHGSYTPTLWSLLCITSKFTNVVATDIAKKSPRCTFSGSKLKWRCIYCSHKCSCCAKSYCNFLFQVSYAAQTLSGSVSDSVRISINLEDQLKLIILPLSWPINRLISTKMRRSYFGPMYVCGGVCVCLFAADTILMNVKHQTNVRLCLNPCKRQMSKYPNNCMTLQSQG